MKKTLVIALGLAVLAGGAFAQTNQVLSRNAVGYIKQTTVKSNFFLVTNPFNDINGGPVTVTNLIGNQVPNGTVVMLWDPSGQEYRFETRSAGLWIPGTNRIGPGRGFWLKMATTASHSNNYQVYLMGEVPDKFTLPSNTMAVLPAFNLIANPYPVTTPYTSLVASLPPRNGDVGILWDAANQAYVFESRSAGLWIPGTNMLSPGQGFWYKSSRTSNMTLTVTKPYTWP